MIKDFNFRFDGDCYLRHDDSNDDDGGGGGGLFSGVLQEWFMDRCLGLISFLSDSNQRHSQYVLQGPSWKVSFVSWH